MKISREFKIGFVAVIAVALGVWGINYLKGINIFSSNDRYYAVYGNVKGLVENAVVYLNGYKIGNVNKIEFNEKNTNQIVVVINIEENLKFRKGTRMVIKSGSLISGSKEIEVINGNEEGYYEPGDTLPSGMEVQITDYIDPVKQKLESLVSAVDSVLYAINDLIDPATRKNLQEMIANLNSTTNSLKVSLQPSGSLGSSFDNLSQITENLKQNNEDITRLINNLSSVSDSLSQAELKALINNASATFAQTSELFQTINSGKGTAGQLIVNDSVYNNLNHALASLDSLLIDLKEHPKRYVHLSVFGKKDK